jgi:hypothetical protein
MWLNAPNITIPSDLLMLEYKKCHHPAKVKRFESHRKWPENGLSLDSLNRLWGKSNYELRNTNVDN